ncbi:serine protease [Streptacidiphilus jiangxiensis]|uniref:Trypsin-like peptidase domain-containing protein n=1 Tax=Streptacidiphilus jiangxiensis TaxID=235985 RepID=A0A1H7Q1Y3_STRJI|nr:serine protease [Streptacidiphilus jiangxiensis]SEL41718.1 Trypsin-like peptidase domain-containing protein [Streptacidiphilus jiangxiensis]
MTHPQRERIAVVFGEGQGSGYLLSPWLVLTAAHVIGDAVAPSVAVPGQSGGRVDCEVVWRRYDERCDLALLRAENALVQPSVYQHFEPLTWGVVTDLQPREGAVAVGFPQANRSALRQLDTEQAVGTLKPGTGLRTGRPVLQLSGMPPQADGTQVSPWAGMSGASVFLENRLIGVVRSVPAQWQDGRLELTPSGAYVQDPTLLEICEHANVVLRWGTVEPPELSFEERLRAYLSREWEKVRIYGVTRSGRGDGSWRLDIAYLSLELAGSERPVQAADEEDAAPVAQRAPDALAQQPRILLRGNAGSGKTTLLQWLTTLTARGELPEQLTQFKDCTPILLRLRALARPGQALPSPEEFLRASGSPLAGFPGSEGWVSRRMAEGRVLLLVDGIDEAPESERRRVREWLSGLLGAYPETRCLVTTRPSAVREGWLADLGFAELDLLPMSRSDVAAFIDRWHAAAAESADAGTDPEQAREQRERLARWRDVLTEAVGRKQDLGRLATNPLMCSLICALNADRQGHLPSGRMALYDAALEMLLVRRDEERGVDPASEGLALSEAQQQALLQRLAYWLIRNGQSELAREQALARIERALPQMPQIQGTPEQVLRHLLVRSGLLREPAPGAIDFVHRTFQDYLGAQAAIEEGDLPLLVEHAHEDQWEDVIRLAVGHARRRERAELLTRILRRAEAEPAHADRLRLLAAACLDMAVELDPAVRDQVTAATAALVPPQDVEAAKDLAQAGPVVLELLPGPEGLDDATAQAVVVCATRCTSNRAIPLLASYAHHPNIELRMELARAWPWFDTEEYGRAVITPLAEQEDLRLFVSSRAQAEFVASLPAVHRVEFVGPLGPDVVDLVPLGRLRELRFHENPLPTDLGLVRAAPLLTTFMLFNDTGQVDLAPLAGTAVKRVIVLSCTGVASLAALGAMPELEHLSFANAAQPFTAGLDLRHVLAAPKLNSLRLMATDLALEDWELLRRHERLESLDLEALDLARLSGLGPFPQVRVLHLRYAKGLDAPERITEAFPGITSLWFHGAPPVLALDGLPPGLLVGTDGPAPLGGAELDAPPPLQFSGNLTWYRVR